MTSLFKFGGGGGNSEGLNFFKCRLKEDIKIAEIDARQLCSCSYCEDKLYVAYTKNGSFVNVYDEDLNLIKTITLSNELAPSQCSCCDGMGNMYFSGKRGLIKLDKNNKESLIPVSCTPYQMQSFRNYVYYEEGSQLSRVNIFTLKQETVVSTNSTYKYGINEVGETFVSYYNSSYVYLLKFVDGEKVSTEKVERKDNETIDYVFACKNYVLVVTGSQFIKFHSNGRFIGKTNSRNFASMYQTFQNGSFIKINGLPSAVGEYGIYMFDETGENILSFFSKVTLSKEYRDYVSARFNEKNGKLCGLCWNVVPNSNNKKITITQSSNCSFVERE